MSTTKDFLTRLARKAGFDTESATAKTFFDSLPDTEIPDEVSHGIDNSLISLTDAKNNHPILKNHYKKQTLDGFDALVNEGISSYELGDEDAAEIQKEDSTYKKTLALIKKVATLSEKKAAATSGKGKETIQKEIDKLHQDIAAEKAARAQDKTSFEEQLRRNKMEVKLSSLLASVKTIHDELDADTRGTIINTLLNKELQDKQAKFEFDEQGNLVLLKNDGTNYYGENHQQISPSQFIDETLAKTKQLKVSSGSNGANSSTQRAFAPANGNGKAESNSNAPVIDLNSQSMKDFAAGSVKV